MVGARRARVREFREAKADIPARGLVYAGWDGKLGRCGAPSRPSAPSGLGELAEPSVPRTRPPLTEPFAPRNRPAISMAASGLGELSSPSAPRSRPALHSRISAPSGFGELSERNRPLRHHETPAPLLKGPSAPSGLAQLLEPSAPPSKPEKAEPRVYASKIAKWETTLRGEPDQRAVKWVDPSVAVAPAISAVYRGWHRARVVDTYFAPEPAAEARKQGGKRPPPLAAIGSGGAPPGPGVTRRGSAAARAAARLGSAPAAPSPVRRVSIVIQRAAVALGLAQDEQNTPPNAAEEPGAGTNSPPPGRKASTISPQPGRKASTISPGKRTSLKGREELGALTVCPMRKGTALQGSPLSFVSAEFLEPVDAGPTGAGGIVPESPGVSSRAPALVLVPTSSGGRASPGCRTSSGWARQGLASPFKRASTRSRYGVDPLESPTETPDEFEYPAESPAESPTKTRLSSLAAYLPTMFHSPGQ